MVEGDLARREVLAQGADFGGVEVVEAVVVGETGHHLVERWPSTLQGHIHEATSLLF